MAKVCSAQSNRETKRPNQTPNNESNSAQQVPSGHGNF
jgi:hypothetical protein